MQGRQILAFIVDSIVIEALRWSDLIEVCCRLCLKVLKVNVRLVLRQIVVGASRRQYGRWSLKRVVISWDDVCVIVKKPILVLFCCLISPTVFPDYRLKSISAFTATQTVICSLAKKHISVGILEFHNSRVHLVNSNLEGLEVSSHPYDVPV